MVPPFPGNKKIAWNCQDYLTSILNQRNYRQNRFVELGQKKGIPKERVLRALDESRVSCLQFKCYFWMAWTLELTFSSHGNGKWPYYMEIMEPQTNPFSISLIVIGVRHVNFNLDSYKVLLCGHRDQT